MSEEKDAFEIVESKPGLADGILRIIQEEFEKKRLRFEDDPSCVVGPNDPRLCITSHKQVASGQKGVGIRLPLNLNFDMLMTYDTRSKFEHWSLTETHNLIKALLVNEAPELSAMQLREALTEFVPHAIRIATVVWHDEKILMRLKNSGTADNPASVIEFPQATMLGHDASFDEAALRIAKSAFSPIIKPNWDVELHDLWNVFCPDRSEIILVRHADFTGDPNMFFGPWSEELYFPYVWVSLENVFDASCGDNSALLAEIREADVYYRSMGRELITEVVADESCDSCSSTLKSSNHKLPIKSSLTISDDLQVDAVCLSIMQSVLF